MTNEKVHDASCFCGAVRMRLEGPPAAMGYCHCASCRRWSAGPVNAFTLWAPPAVRITQGEDLVGSYQGSENSIRHFCRSCGGHLKTDHPKWGLVDVFAAVIDGLDFEPGVHVNYAETVLPMRDGLPKQHDFPTDLGGSGELMRE